MEEYKPTADELKLQAKFTLTGGSMHEWTIQEKAAYLKYLNNRAGLPFGTIGMIRTEHKNKNGAPPTIKEIPYASRQTTVELGRKHNVSVTQVKEAISDEMIRYTYKATDLATGRSVDAVGACSLIGWDKPLSADQKANKFMHAETKAKRRATLEVCGLAFLDDSEVEDMPDAVRVDVETGEVVKPEAPKENAVNPGANVASTATIETVTAAATGTNAAALIKARYDGNPLFAGDDSAAIVADPAHINFIVTEATEKAGWDKAALAKWLFDGFGVRMSNVKETLTLDVFRRIMAAVDMAIANRAGGQ